MILLDQILVKQYNDNTIFIIGAICLLSYVAYKIYKIWYPNNK